MAAAALVLGVVVRYGPCGVKFDHAAAGEQVPELPACPLHPRLHPGHRDTKLVGGVLMGLPVEVDAGQGVSCRVAELGQEWLEAACQLPSRLVGFVARHVGVWQL